MSFCDIKTIDRRSKNPSKPNIPKMVWRPPDHQNSIFGHLHHRLNISTIKRDILCNKNQENSDLETSLPVGSCSLRLASLSGGELQGGEAASPNKTSNIPKPFQDLHCGHFREYSQRSNIEKLFKSEHPQNGLETSRPSKLDFSTSSPPT